MSFLVDPPPVRTSLAEKQGPTPLSVRPARVQRGVRRALSDRDKERRRAEILAAAKKVFARKGFHGTTIAEIAQTAELSYGSIYWHFDSKDALFHELMETEGQALRRHVTEALDSPAGGDPEAPFRAAVRATFEFFEVDRALVKLLLRDSYALGDRFERPLFGIYEGFISDIEAIVTDASRRGMVVDYPPRLVAVWVGALVGTLVLQRSPESDQDRS